MEQIFLFEDEFLLRNDAEAAHAEIFTAYLNSFDMNIPET
jgi:hypothetical protein